MRRELLELQLQEAKEHFDDLKDSIHRTRNRIFSVLAIFIAVITFSAEDALKMNLSSLKTFLFIIFFLALTIILVYLRKYLHTVAIAHKGVEPHKFNSVLKEENKYNDVLSELIEAYQYSITVNGKLLDGLTKAYTFIVRALFISIAFFVFFVFIFLYF